MAIDIPSFDYRELVTVLNTGITSHTGLVVKIDNANGTQPEMPFITYSFITPHLDVGYSGSNTPYFDVVMAYTSHSKTNPIEAMEKIDLVRNWFKDEQNQYELTELHQIKVIKIDTSMNIDDALSVGYDRRSQFTVRLRVASPLPKVPDVITNVDIPKGN